MTTCRVCEEAEGPRNAAAAIMRTTTKTLGSAHASGTRPHDMTATQQLDRARAHAEQAVAVGLAFAPVWTPPGDPSSYTWYPSAAFLRALQGVSPLDTRAGSVDRFLEPRDGSGDSPLPAAAAEVARWAALTVEHARARRQP